MFNILQTHSKKAEHSKNVQLVLASSSPQRLSLLRQIGIFPDVICPVDVEETPRKRETPRHLSSRLAVEKILASLTSSFLEKPHPLRFVLAADTVISLGRRPFGKPLDEKQAYEMLLKLSGRAHRVYTTVALQIPSGRVLSKIVETKVRFKRLERLELEDYIKTGEWAGKAGAYAIQGRAASFVRFLSGSYSGVVGLPLCEVKTLLSGAGYPCHNALEEKL